MIKKYLDLSMGHLPEHERERMAEGDITSLIFHDHPYGWWVWVPPDDADLVELREVLPTLAKILDYARNSDCAWVNLDQDADLEEGLEYFEEYGEIPSSDDDSGKVHG